MTNTLRPPSKVTIVEEGTEFQGTLTSSCPVDVRGRVDGELKTPALTVSASGAVHGRAKVGEVRSQGEISGEFDADKIELAGVVRDNTIIRARSLDVKLSSQRGKLQIVFGACELSVGDEPTEHDYANEQAALAAPVVGASVPLEAVPAAPAVLAEVVPAVEAMPVEAAAAPAPEAVAVADAASDVQAAPGAPAEAAAAPNAEDADDESEEGNDTVMAGGSGGKRKKRRKNGHEEPAAGWSHPPSQPPPAN
jgi:cytoskeletal protein CcmA (bactofilin family)